MKKAAVFLAAVTFTSLLCPISAESTLRKVALTGKRAPETEEGVVFLAFGSFFDPNSPLPQIDQQGRVLFHAFLNGPGVNAHNGIGLWSFDGVSTALVVRAGDEAPGTEPDVVFQGFPSGEVPGGFDIVNGTSAIPATLRGTNVDLFDDDGTWSGDSSALQLLLREGQPAPGTGGNFFSPILADFTAAGSLFSSPLIGSGINDDNDESIWTLHNGMLTLRARESAPAPGTTVFFGRGDIGAGPSTFPHADFNDAGHLALRGNLLGSGVNAHHDEALFVDRGAGLQLLLREGNPAPGAGRRVTFGGNSVQLGIFSLMMNGAGRVAFPVRLGGGRGKKTTTTEALYSDHRGSLLPIAIAGDPAPGTGKTFKVLRAPFLSDASRVAFFASVDEDFRPRFGIFWDQSGSVTPLILPGAAIPERAGATLYEATSIAGYTAAGFLAFRAHVQLPSNAVVTAALAAEPDGTLHTLVAAGDIVEVSTNDLREVSAVQGGELAANGTLVLRLHFADGSSGIFTTELPGTP